MLLTGNSTEPELAFLPWDLSLEQWSEDLVVALPRGISRHVVRFVRINGRVYAVKEIEQYYASREYALLHELLGRDVPTVSPVAVISDRIDVHGEPLPSALITEHLKFSLPYRALFSSSLRLDTASRLATSSLFATINQAQIKWRIFACPRAWNDADNPFEHVPANGTKSEKLGLLS